MGRAVISTSLLALVLVGTSGTGAWAAPTPDGEWLWAAGNLVFDEFGNVTEITGTSVSICELLV